MTTAVLGPALLLLVAYPAPKEPEPDSRGRGFFGVQLIDNGGVVITRVEQGSPAHRAGLQATDIIQSIDKAPVADVEEAREAIARLRPGSVSRVELRRGGNIITVKVNVGIRPDALP